MEVLSEIFAVYCFFPPKILYGNSKFVSFSNCFSKINLAGKKGPFKQALGIHYADFEKSFELILIFSSDIILWERLGKTYNPFSASNLNQALRRVARRPYRKRQDHSLPENFVQLFLTRTFSLYNSVQKFHYPKKSEKTHLHMRKCCLPAASRNWEFVLLKTTFVTLNLRVAPQLYSDVRKKFDLVAENAMNS